jgi:hypothetical protein
MTEVRIQMALHIVLVLAPVGENVVVNQQRCVEGCWWHSLPGQLSEADKGDLERQVVVVPRPQILGVLGAASLSITKDQFPECKFGSS